jgi:glutamate/tyrosine decarboxylase-like PLP-dependent enzyme
MLLEIRRRVTYIAARPFETGDNMDRKSLLVRTAEHANRFLDTLPTRKVRAEADIDELRASLGGDLPDYGIDAATVVEDLARNSDPGLVASAGPRFYGFVIGGGYPVAVAADWLTSTWDQNSALYIASPATSVIEETAAAWLLDLLGLPRSASVGFVTGCHMANYTALMTARDEMFRRAGWDIEQKGLTGAPQIHVVVGGDAHSSIYAALRYLGLGRKQVKVVPADDQGRMIASELPSVLQQCDGPTIVCAQAGNVNSGSFDPVGEIVDLVRAHGGWLHVDGAFGLWAQAVPSLKHLTEGIERADSWATDAHKWLNVPYDCGIVICGDSGAHLRAGGATAAYFIPSERGERDNFMYVPEMSRRGRGVPVYATLRHLGRQGIAELIERCCHLARLMADRLDAAPNASVLNDVVLNQVLVRFHPQDGSDTGEFTEDVITRVQQEGTCWLSGTTWQGQAAMRISISNWSTTEEDIERSAEAIIAVSGT